MSDTQKIETIVETPPFAPIDVHFARLMQKFAGGKKPELLLAAALVSHFRGEGHICLDLAHFHADRHLGETTIDVPPLDKWLQKLRAASVVGTPTNFRPLILDGNRLYLHRYWQYEQNLAEKIKAHLQPVPYDEKVLRDGLQRLFGSNKGATDLNWQKVAAFAAVTRRFCVVSGGPGTGKTSTVLNILALLLEQTPGLRIALAAPTGKAASRLQEAIENAKEKLPVSAKIKTALPRSASTIHRLLGTIPDSPYFRRDAKSPLPFDVIVLDEASMVDLALMTKLFAAVRDTARIILLGDKDQLSSVEAGAVLGDICSGVSENAFSSGFCAEYKQVTSEDLPETQPANGLLGDHIVQLQKNHRFGEDNAIFAFSRNITEGNLPGVKRLLRKKTEEFAWSEISSRQNFEPEFRRRVVEGFQDFLSAATPAEALQKFDQFRILSAVRYGPFGVVELNRKVEKILTNAGLIDSAKPWYAGRPIMVLSNDYNLKLFNGDIGIIAHDPVSGELRAFFSGTENELRKFSPARLPEHETVFAMTVHKSQGSEFGDVLFILPQNDGPVLTRELIYTGITRARRKVELWGNETVLETALQRRVQRWSGLPEILGPRSAVFVS